MTATTFCSLILPSFEGKGSLMETLSVYYCNKLDAEANASHSDFPLSLLYSLGLCILPSFIKLELWDYELVRLNTTPPQNFFPEYV